MRSLILTGAIALAVCSLAACGGGGGSTQPSTRTIRGSHFVFRAPFDWHVRRRGNEVGVTISDTGPGIPADARERIFDRFYRADPSRSRESGGSGLGLAICHEIVDAHGGRIWVESEEGEGSAFSIALRAR